MKRNVLAAALVCVCTVSVQANCDWSGYVPQDHVLFSRSIRENIKFGKEDATEEEIREAIRLAYFEKDLEILPQHKRYSMLWLDQGHP